VSTAAEGLPPPGKQRTPFVVAADDVTWRTLAVFCSYRVVLAVFVTVAFVFLNRFFNLGVMAPGVMVPTLAGYTILSLLLLVPARVREPSLTLQVTAGVFLDVFAIVMLMYASGGVRSGLGVVLLVSLAAAGLITRGRLAYFHAATAALAVLLEQTFQLWRHDAGPQEFLQAGITAGAFFATAGLASALARYARTSEQIAAERGVDLANLSQINEIVIRDMQDGILVVDGDGRIRQNNPRSTQLLGPLPMGRWPFLSDYAPEIAKLLEGWREGKSETTFMQLRTPRSAGELQVHFVPIGGGNPSPIVVFVEDVGRMRAQAQHMKLVALGRLTASIAHEIRNPLSSIGHAAELLDEDGAMEEADKRLLSIIRGNVFRIDRIVQEVLYSEPPRPRAARGARCRRVHAGLRHRVRDRRARARGHHRRAGAHRAAPALRPAAPGPGDVEHRAQCVALLHPQARVDPHRRVARRGHGAAADRRARRRAPASRPDAVAPLRAVLHHRHAGHRAWACILRASCARATARAWSTSRIPPGASSALLSRERN
jgi:two-component system sensor histidine kinase PilS (NtrC family)